MIDDIDPWRADEENSYQESLRKRDLREEIMQAVSAHRPKHKQRAEGYDLAVRLILEKVT